MKLIAQKLPLFIRQIGKMSSLSKSKGVSISIIAISLSYVLVSYSGWMRTFTMFLVIAFFILVMSSVPKTTCRVLLGFWALLSSTFLKCSNYYRNNIKFSILQYSVTVCYERDKTSLNKLCHCSVHLKLTLEVKVALSFPNLWQYIQQWWISYLVGHWRIHIWHETKLARIVNQISTCMHCQLLTLQVEVSNMVLYSDACRSQN